MRRTSRHTAAHLIRNAEVPDLHSIQARRTRAGLFPFPAHAGHDPENSALSSGSWHRSRPFPACAGRDPENSALPSGSWHRTRPFSYHAGRDPDRCAVSSGSWHRNSPLTSLAGRDPDRYAVSSGSWHRSRPFPACAGRVQDRFDVSSGSWQGEVRWARQRVGGGPFVLRTSSPSRCALRTHSRGHGRPRVRHPTLRQRSTHPTDPCASTARRKAILCAKVRGNDGKRLEQDTLAQAQCARRAIPCARGAASLCANGAKSPEERADILEVRFRILIFEESCGRSATEDARDAHTGA